LVLRLAIEARRAALALEPMANLDEMLRLIAHLCPKMPRSLLFLICLYLSQELVLRPFQSQNRSLVDAGCARRKQTWQKQQGRPLP